MVINNKHKLKNAGVAPAHEALTTLTTPLKNAKRALGNIVNHVEVSEKEIERYLVREVARLGLPCLKYSNPCMAGYPDRIVVLRDGRVVWVELKSRGRKPTKLQRLRMAELTGMGHAVEVIDSKAEIDNLINSIKR